MKSLLLLVVFCGVGLCSLSGQELKCDFLDIPPVEQIVDHSHDVITQLPVDRRIMPADEIYRNIWNNYSLVYPSQKMVGKSSMLTLALKGAEDNRYVHPFPGRILSRFGRRGRRMHTGIDVKLYRGDSVRCAFDGRVRMARRVNGYGNMVLVRHYNGLETLYGHFSKIKVKANQLVRAGDLLGLGGRTGRATTEHLHFETRIFGEPFDPEKCIDFKKGTLLVDSIFYQNHRTEANMALFSSKEDGRGTTSHPLYYRIKKGDTLSSVARRYKTSVRSLCRQNRISATKILRIGEMLRVDG